MNVPLTESRIRLIISGSALLLLIIAACTQRPAVRLTPVPVTAQLPMTGTQTPIESGRLLPAASPPTPAIQIVRETVVVTATPLPLTQAAPAGALAATGGGSSPFCNRNINVAEKIVIGTIYPLTNVAMMQNGFAMQAATNFAVEEINNQGGINGKPLEIIAYDSGSLPAQGARMAERLITADCVAAIVGIFHSDVAVAVKEVAVRYHVPVIFADPYAEEITADQPAEVFRIAPLRTMFTEMMGQWLAAIGDYNQDQVVHAVVLAENSTYGQIRLEAAKEILPKFGIEVECFTLELPTTDFSPVIARIVALDTLPDVIFLNLHGEAVLPLQQQLVAAGMGPERNTLLVSTDAALNDTQFWQQVPAGNFGIALHVGPWPSTVSVIGEAFAQRYEQRFQRWPEAIAFEAYDAMWLMADAIGRAKSIHADDMIAALEETDITLASGHYTFPYGKGHPPDGVAAPTYLWHQWLEPQLLYLQYTEPQQLAVDALVIWPPAYQTTGEALAPTLINRPLLLGRR